jgi:(1->4)-alpha-D-glucan 1-alpha-D-glucosylmutase
VVEKILGEHETLRPFAGVEGTTGYETLNTISRVLANPNGLEALDETWRQISNMPPALGPVLKAAKQRVLETLLASEFTVLARLLARIAAGHYSTRDFSADSLRQALELYVLNFPIYRTYLTAAGASADDRALISDTIEKARNEWYAADEGIFDFLRDALTMDLAKPGPALHSAPRVRRFALKVQQFTGPLMAKSLEDTAFYRTHRLLALNEVGGEPSASALSPAAFHQMMVTRSHDWPHAMTTTATHDTKRGEDARARLIALSELAGEWTGAVARWKLLNAPHIVTESGMRAPSATFEYMLYQTLLGVWPLTPPDRSLTERLQAYAVKAAREGKQETSWLNPHEGYETALCTFIDRILNPSASAEFLDSLQGFAQRVALLGALNSLGQITLKAMMPGVPDFYQGTEFLDLSLVDPDNRRPVDFAERADVLTHVERPDWQALIGDWPNGHVKLAWTRHLLKLRNDLADVFTNGDYEPLEVSGPHSDHVVAFARRRGRHAVITAVARWCAPLSEQGRRWPHGDLFEGELHIEGYSLEGADHSNASRVPLAVLFRDLPVAALKADYVGTTNLPAKQSRQLA